MLLKSPPINTVFRLRYRAITIQPNFNKMTRAKFWKIELPISSITKLKSFEQRNKLNKYKSRDPNFCFANQRTQAMIKKFKFAMQMHSVFRIKEDRALQIIITFEMHLVDNQMQLPKQLQNSIDHLLTQKNERNLLLINLFERVRYA